MRALKSFSDTFCPVGFGGARLAEARAYNMLSAITDEPSFAADYLSYAQGYNLTNRMPLFVSVPKVRTCWTYDPRDTHGIHMAYLTGRGACAELRLSEHDELAHAHALRRDLVSRVAGPPF